MKNPHNKNLPYNNPPYSVEVKGSAKAAFNTNALADATKATVKEIQHLAAKHAGGPLPQIKNVVERLGVIVIYPCDAAFAKKVAKLPSVKNIKRMNVL